MKLPDYFKIENYAAQIEQKDLTEIPLPCLAVLNIGKGKFIMIDEVKDYFIKWYDTESGNQHETIAIFCEKWEGIVLLAQVLESSGDIDYYQNKRKERLERIGHISLLLGGITALTLFLFLVFYSKTFSIYIPFLIITKGIGILVNILLLWYLLDKSNPFLKNICKIGNSTDCNAILDSKAASLGGVISWSEIGFFYFTGTFIALVFGFSNNVVLSTLAFINLIALPYSIFSIYYQAFVAKKWCILCLSVQILLWIEYLFFSFVDYSRPFYKEAFSVALLLLSFIFPCLIWFSLKSTLIQALQKPFLEKSNSIKARLH